MFAFGTIGKTGEPAELADARHAVFAAGQDLMDVDLMADIPDDFVFRGIEQAVEGDGEFDHAQIGGEMAAAADTVHGVDEEVADFIGELFELLVREPAEVSGAVNTIENLGQPVVPSATK